MPKSPDDPHAAYLGDSVYVTIRHGTLVLTTNNGYGPTNTIFLEQEVYQALVQYVDSLKKKH